MGSDSQAKYSHKQSFVRLLRCGLFTGVFFLWIAVIDVRFFSGELVQEAETEFQKVETKLTQVEQRALRRLRQQNNGESSDESEREQEVVAKQQEAAATSEQQAQQPQHELTEEEIEEQMAELHHIPRGHHHFDKKILEQIPKDHSVHRHYHEKKLGHELFDVLDMEEQLIEMGLAKRDQYHQVNHDFVVEGRKNVHEFKL